MLDPISSAGRTWDWAPFKTAASRSDPGKRAAPAVPAASRGTGAIAGKTGTSPTTRYVTLSPFCFSFHLPYAVSFSRLQNNNGLSSVFGTDKEAQAMAQKDMDTIKHKRSAAGANAGALKSKYKKRSVGSLSLCLASLRPFAHYYYFLFFLSFSERRPQDDATLAIFVRRQNGAGVPTARERCATRVACVSSYFFSLILPCLLPCATVPTYPNKPIADVVPLPSLVVISQTMPSSSAGGTNARVTARGRCPLSILRCFAILHVWLR